MKLAIGIILLIITTILGIFLLVEDCGACDNATISFHKNLMVGNFAGWILGILLTVHGAQDRSKMKRVKQQKQDDELSDLKNRIKDLEKDESKSQIDSKDKTIKELEKKIREEYDKKSDSFKPSAKLIDDEK